MLVTSQVYTKIFDNLKKVKTSLLKRSEFKYWNKEMVSEAGSIHFC